MVVLLKTTSVRVSFIQIMQVRVQNKGKSVWKSRYDGDVSGFKTVCIALTRTSVLTENPKIFLVLLLFVGSFPV